MKSELFYVTKRTARPSAGQSFVGEKSLTVPGESWSIAELMERAINGVPVSAVRDPFFNDAELDHINEWYRPLIDITQLDEIREHAKVLSRAVDELDKKRKAESAEKKAKAAEEALERNKVLDELAAERKRKKDAS